MPTKQIPHIVHHLKSWKQDNRQKERIILIDGHGLSIRVESIKNNRFRFLIVHDRCYTCPWHVRSLIQPESITVSKQRPPKNIANDIERRLIIPYKKKYESALPSIEEHKQKLEWCNRIENILRTVCKLGPKSNHKNQETRRKITFGSILKHDPLGVLDISTYKGGKVDLELSDLSPDQAIKLMHFYFEQVREQS